ncbi:MAG: NAD(P)-dependent oxidoreductase [Candidatus Cloacimonetes bacterium]|nr:NAD(P)-dependent oxidoreductase [Candidatus Cloacimonadota bacterium]
MTGTQIGFLHPGAMGVSLAASAAASGCVPCWVSEGRSPATRERADSHGLQEVASLRELCERCSILVSICPPHAADAVARQVREMGYRGIYADFNAISPDRMREIGRLQHEAGMKAVDGTIIGPPAWHPDSTTLFLAGPMAQELAECFAAAPLRTRVIGDGIGRASALKMCYAAVSKGRAALNCAVLAAAESLGVREELESCWDEDLAGSSERIREQARRVTAKAWRFQGEMAEIAATLSAAGVPEGFHEAAGEIYARMAPFKDAAKLPELDSVLAALRGRQGTDVPGE